MEDGGWPRLRSTAVSGTNRSKLVASERAGPSEAVPPVTLLRLRLCAQPRRARHPSAPTISHFVCFAYFVVLHPVTKPASS